MKVFAVFLLMVMAVCYTASLFYMASATLVLIGDNFTLSFEDVEANFARAIKRTGECGVLYSAEPLDACTDFINNSEQILNSTSPFLLVIRGDCSFEDKVRRAQQAGFKAVIVYDDEDDGMLVAMSGNAAGIKIPAVFISKASGEKLGQYVGSKDKKLCMFANVESTAWSIMAVSFISLLAISAVLATCFFVRRHRIRRQSSRVALVREFHGMSSRLVRAMPSQIFTTVLEDNSTAGTCAICLEDYSVGDRLRVLPCHHKFHAFCVDSWLTTWRTFCPVCKRDARTATGEPPASESTPLLSSSPASSVISSSGSTIQQPSPAIQIGRGSWSSVSHSTTPYFQHHSLRSSSLSHSAVLHIGSSRRSCTSPHSPFYPSTSPLNTRYMSVYRPSPSNASPILVGSSSRQFLPLHYSQSAGTFSPYASAQSLPDC